LSYTPRGAKSLSFGTGLPWTPGWPVSRDGIHRAPMRPAFNAATTHEMQEAIATAIDFRGPILPRLYSPRSLNDGWSAGAAPSGQWYFPLRLLDRQVVDAGDAQAHQAMLVKLQFSLP